MADYKMTFQTKEVTIDPQMTFSIKVNEKSNFTVYVETYFVKASINDIKKVFAMAKESCTGKQRKQLISNLKSAKDFWTGIRENARRVHIHNYKLVSIIPSTDKKLKELQEKLDKVIGILESEIWQNESAKKTTAKKQQQKKSALKRSQERAMTKFVNSAKERGHNSELAGKFAGGFFSDGAHIIAVIDSFKKQAAEITPDKLRKIFDDKCKASKAYSNPKYRIESNDIIFTKTGEKIQNDDFVKINDDFGFRVDFLKNLIAFCNGAVEIEIVNGEFAMFSAKGIKGVVSGALKIWLDKSVATIGKFIGSTKANKKVFVEADINDYAVNQEAMELAVEVEETLASLAWSDDRPAVIYSIAKDKECEEYQKEYESKYDDDSENNGIDYNLIHFGYCNMTFEQAILDIQGIESKENKVYPLKNGFGDLLAICLVHKNDIIVYDYRNEYQKALTTERIDNDNYVVRSYDADQITYTTTLSGITHKEAMQFIREQTSMVNIFDGCYEEKHYQIVDIAGNTEEEIRSYKNEGMDSASTETMHLKAVDSQNIDNATSNLKAYNYILSKTGEMEIEESDASQGKYRIEALLSFDDNTKIIIDYTDNRNAGSILDTNCFFIAKWIVITDATTGEAEYQCGGNKELLLQKLWDCLPSDSIKEGSRIIAVINEAENKIKEAKKECDKIEGHAFTHPSTFAKQAKESLSDSSMLIYYMQKTGKIEGEYLIFKCHYIAATMLRFGKKYLKNNELIQLQMDQDEVTENIKLKINCIKVVLEAAIEQAKERLNHAKYLLDLELKQKKECNIKECQMTQDIPEALTYEPKATAQNYQNSNKRIVKNSAISRNGKNKQIRIVKERRIAEMEYGKECARPPN